MEKPRVYSYSRFSSAAQAAGTSLARQQDYAAKWAEAHGLALDSALTLRDEGLSAYHGKHVKAGALGTFLRAVEDGKVPVGSVLIVEQLDRLSRAEPIVAQTQLAAIVMAGIRVITAADGREYSRATLKKEPFGLITSLITMVRAWEESESKSQRAKGAMAARCKQWIAGTWLGHIGPPSGDPGWLRRTPDGFEFIEERVAAIRTMIELYKGGRGGLNCVRELDRLGLRLSPGANSSDRVRQILRSRALYGEHRVTVDEETFTLANYFPALISEDEWHALQQLSKERGRRRSKGEIPAVLTGMDIALCGYCGSRMVAQNEEARIAKTGSLVGYRRLVCVGGKRHSNRCPVGGSVQAAIVENAIMAYCSDVANLERLVSGNDGSEARAAALARARGAAHATQQQIDGLMAVILADPTAAPAAFATKVKTLETDLKAQHQEVERLEQESAAEARATPATADAWAALADGVARLDSDARLKARQLIADSFSGIEIARLGFDPSTDDGVPPYDTGVLGIFLHGRRGSGRVFTIDRATGEFLIGHDLAGHQATEIPPEKFGKP